MSPLVDLLVVGGGLSGLTAAYRAQQKGWSFRLLESSTRLGGALETTREDGCTLELGAESMVTAKPWGKALCQELGLGDQLVGARQEFGETRVARGSRLLPIPQGLRLIAPARWGPLLRSPLLSWRGKARLALDFLLPRRRAAGDESLANFVRRRLGQEALERIAQPLVAGIYTADPETLSMQATLPQFLDYEQRYGSVCRGLRRSAEARAAAGPRYQLFCSLAEGFGQLIGALVRALPADCLQLNADTSSLRFEDGVWKVGEMQGRRLLLACPAWAAARLLASHDPVLARQLQSWTYLSSATVNLSYPAAPLDACTRAFGFVVPAIERSDILACTFSHRKYPGRTPPDTALLRTYLGGAARPEALDWSDAEMIERSHRELKRWLGFEATPRAAVVKRYVRAMPLYAVGHLERVRLLEDSVARWPGLALTGNYLRGVGIPDCIREAEAALHRLQVQDSVPL